MERIVRKAGVAAITAMVMTVVTSCGGKIVEPEAVDLGLSVKWASWNVGASEPGDYGLYYAWGETEDKSNYKGTNYKYATVGEDGTPKLKKYCNDSEWGEGGYKDDKRELEAGDDAASANIGVKWRIPTKEEWAELMDEANCKWERVMEGEKAVWRVTSKKTGFEGRSIVLPGAGQKDGSSSYGEGGTGFYWSATSDESMPSMAYMANFSDDEPEVGSSDKYYGMPIRAVMSK